MTYTVTHSEWSEDPYGWQVLDLDGEVIDVYEQRPLAQAYADYMNQRRTRARGCGYCTHCGYGGEGVPTCLHITTKENR